MKIEPIAHCGMPPKFSRYKRYPDGWLWVVSCRKPSCPHNEFNSNHVGETKAEAINIWNQRANNWRGGALDYKSKTPPA